MIRQKHTFGIALVFLILVQMACNMPRGGTPTPSGADAIYTAAAQTVEAQLTQVSQPPATTGAITGVAPSATPISQLTPSNTPSQATGQPTAATAIATNTPVPCDLVNFVKDVTYPDNSEVAAGESFVKTWRLKNAGSCTWTTDYALAFAGGDRMGAPDTVSLTGNVAPGETVDVSVTLTGPDDGGTYRGDWKLRNASGVLFGLGNGTKPFWVQVKVPLATGIVYDFLVNAKDAEWNSGTGNNPGTPLTYGGDDLDPDGVAKIKDKVKLETGATSGKVLLTYPKRVDDGYVSGLFPAYKVQNGDRFKARLGFMIPEGETDCGSGEVEFELNYKEGDTWHKYKKWTKSCDGEFLVVNIDLSELKGKEVRFEFLVQADGSSEDDWSIWNSALIEQ